MCIYYLSFDSSELRCVRFLLNGEASWRSRFGSYTFDIERQLLNDLMDFCGKQTVAYIRRLVDGLGRPGLSFVAAEPRSD